MTKSSHKNKADNEKTIYTLASVFLAKCINAKPIAMHNDNSAMNILCWGMLFLQGAVRNVKCIGKCMIHGEK